VLTCCWSVKGGSGTTVVAAALALLAASAPDGALFADLGGDAPAALGLPEPPGPGVWDWLAADPAVEAEALAHLTNAVTPGLRLLPAGAGRSAVAPPPRSRVDLLARALADERGTVVADLGVLDPLIAPMLAAADSSLLVVRACYLALRRAIRLPTRPTGVVLVCEPGRALGRREVEDAIGARVLAEVDVDPAIARAVDAGLLAGRLPRGLARRLRVAA
jgi:MinD-like ATPase involved in chromosome partitioning or flagellar assembly